MSKENDRFFGPVAVALGAGLWGLETIFRVKLQAHFSAQVLVLIEHALAVLLISPLLFIYRRDFKKFTRESWKWLLISGFVGSALGTVFFTLSLKQVNVAVATVLLNLQPLVGVAMSRLLLNERVAKGLGPWAGLAILAGIVLGIDDFASLKSVQVGSLAGLLLVLGAAACWGTATVAGRGLMTRVPLGIAAPMRLVVGLVGAALLVLIFGQAGNLALQLPKLGDPNILSTYLVFVGFIAILPIFIYFWGLQRTQAVASTFCEMFQAIVAVMVAWLVLGYALKPHQVVAGIVLLSAVTKINLLQAKMRSAK